MKLNHIFEEICEKSKIHLIEVTTGGKASHDEEKWLMWIKIGSRIHGDGQEEIGIPHAHFESKDGESGVFSLQNRNPPKKSSEIIVIKGMISTKWKKIIVNWSKERSKSYPGYTNWYVSRDELV